MAIFNITNGEATNLAVVKVEPIVYDCFTSYEYIVTTNQGDSISIDIAGNHVEAVYINNNVEVPFSDGVTFNYNTSLRVRFLLLNSGTTGVYTNATITITNNTTANYYENYVERQNDTENCFDPVITCTSDLCNDGEDGLNPYITFSDIYNGNAVIIGSYYHIANFDYFVQADKYLIDNVLYENHIEDTLTLSPSHATLDRIDIIVINNNETFSVVEGVPSANPLPTDIDDSTQVQLTFVLVLANTTDPGATDNLVYDENVGEPGEWTISSVAGSINPDSLTDPQNGVKAIEFTASPNNDEIVFTDDALIPTTGDQNLIFRIKFVNIPGGSGHRIRIYVRDATSGDTFQTWITSTNIYGIDVNNISDWQTCIIPLYGALFTLLDYDEIVFTNKKGGASYRIDNIVVQGGTVPVTPPNEDHVTNTSELINDGADGISTYVETDELLAENITTDTTNFDNHLSVADDTVQKALETLDELIAGATSPLTTKGDIYSYDTDNNRLPVGSDGQIITADSAEESGLKWIDNTAVGSISTHTQSVAATTWTFVHNLNTLTPLVTVYGDDTYVTIPLEVRPISLTTVEVDFPTAETGWLTVGSGKLLELEDTERVAIAASAIDWIDPNTDFTKTLTGAVTFTDSNLPTGIITKVITLNLTGDFAITFPAYWTNYGTGVYDGTVDNMIVVMCLNGTGASEDVRYMINPETI